MSLPLQSECIDIASLITSLPADINNLILGHLGANHSDIKNQTEYTLSKLSELDMSHRLYTEIIPLDNPARHFILHDTVTKEVSKLIHMKGLYESITKDYTHFNACIKNFNHRSTHELNNIKDMITSLESYKE